MTGGLFDLLKLTSIPQRIGLAIGGAALLGSVAFNIAHVVEINTLTHDKQALDDRINNQKTGYVVRLSQAQTNNTTCESSLRTQNTNFENLSRSSATKITALQTQYDAEHAQRIKAERSAAAFLAHKPQGSTDAEKVADVDRQVLEDLK